MSVADATPTFHITPADMYPAVMESLVKLHDRVANLGIDVALLRSEIKGVSKWIGVSAGISTLALGLAIIALLQKLVR